MRVDSVFCHSPSPCSLAFSFRLGRELKEDTRFNKCWCWLGRIWFFQLHSRPSLNPLNRGHRFPSSCTIRLLTVDETPSQRRSGFYRAASPAFSWLRVSYISNIRLAAQTPLINSRVKTLLAAPSLSILPRRGYWVTGRNHLISASVTRRLQSSSCGQPGLLVGLLPLCSACLLWPQHGQVSSHPSTPW